MRQGMVCNAVKVLNLRPKRRWERLSRHPEESVWQIVGVFTALCNHKRSVR
jgi:hypothetical protein